MVLNSSDVLYLFCNLLRTYSVGLAMQLFFPGKWNSHIKQGVCFGAFYVARSFLKLYFRIPLVSMVGNLALMFGLSFLMDKKQRIGTRLLAVILIAATSMLVEIVVWTTVTIHPLPTEIQDGITTLTSALMLYIIVEGAAGFINTSGSYLVRTPQLLVVLCTPLASIVLVGILNYYMPYAKPRHLVVIYSIILLINIINAYFYHIMTNSLQKEKEQELNQLQNEAYKKQYSLIQESMVLANGMRHDLKNIVCGLQGYLHQEDFQGAQTYVDTLLGKIQQDKLVSSNTGIPAIDSIINYKAIAAKELGVDIEVQQDLWEEVKIIPADLAALLGNLLDNATEAAAKLPAKPQKVDISLSLRRNVFTVQISNPYQGTVRAGLETTKLHPQAHGYGLKNIRRIAEKYQGDVHISHANQIFQCKVVMFNEMH